MGVLALTADCRSRVVRFAAIAGRGPESKSRCFGCDESPVGIHDGEVTGREPGPTANRQAHKCLGLLNRCL